MLWQASGKIDANSFQLGVVLTTALRTPLIMGRNEAEKG